MRRHRGELLLAGHSLCSGSAAMAQYLPKQVLLYVRASHQEKDKEDGKPRMHFSMAPPPFSSCGGGTKYACLHFSRTCSPSRVYLGMAFGFWLLVGTRKIPRVLSVSHTTACTEDGGVSGSVMLRLCTRISSLGFP